MTIDPIPCNCGNGSCMLCDDAGMLHPTVEAAAESIALDEAMEFRAKSPQFDGMNVPEAARAAWSVASDTMFADASDADLEHAESVFLDVFVRVATMGMTTS